MPAAFRSQNLKALHVLPVRTLEQLLGTLLVGTSGSVALSPEKGGLLNALVNHLAMVLENVRLRRTQRDYSLRLEDTVRERTADLVRKEQEQRALLEINRAISAHLDRENLFQAITNAVRPVVPFDHLGIVLLRPNENDLLLYVFEAQEETTYVRRGTTFSRVGTIAGWVLEHKQSFVASSREDLRPFPVSLDLVVKEDMQSSCALPLLVKDRVVGTLSFIGKAQGMYDSADPPFLEEIAAAVAVALDKSLAYEEIKQLEEQQRVLLEINQAVSAHLDREELFHAIANSVRSMVSFDGMGIALLSPEEDIVLYFFEIEEGPAFHHPGARLRRGKSVGGWVLEHKRPFVSSRLEDLRPFPDSLDALTKEGMQSMCALPLLVKGRAMGFLVFMGRAQGTYDSADLPFLEEMAAAVAVAVDKSLAYEEIKQLKDRLNLENIYLQEEIKTAHNFEEIVGESRTLKKVLKGVEMVAGTDSSVLITGETGTGKELVARAIHHLSQRKNRVLINVNCAALPAGLIESELLGHEKGAFTGALSRKMGRFELADKGTIFLDEIGDIPPELQAKLLRVLQEHELERVGGTQTIKVDVRVIAATNRDLEKAVKENRFREDLYYRLNVFPIPLPPLRERKEDISLLVQYFVNKHTLRLGKSIEKIRQETMEQLTAYPWPGNVRELENVIERAVILSKGPTLEVGDDLLASSNLGDSEETASLTLEEIERNHILKVLERTQGVIEGPKGAARILNLHPNTLRSRLKKLGIK